jgi:hypothetical protein
VGGTGVVPASVGGDGVGGAFVGGAFVGGVGVGGDFVGGASVGADWVGGACVGGAAVGGAPVGICAAIVGADWVGGAAVGGATGGSAVGIALRLRRRPPNLRSRLRVAFSSAYDTVTNKSNNPMEVRRPMPLWLRRRLISGERFASCISGIQRR